MATKYSVRLTVTGLEESAAVGLAVVLQDLLSAYQKSEDNMTGFEHSGASVSWGVDDAVLEQPHGKPNVHPV